MWFIRELLIAAAFVVAGAFLGAGLVQANKAIDRIETTVQTLYDGILMSYASGCVGVGTPEQNYEKTQMCKLYAEEYVREFLPVLFEEARK